MTRQADRITDKQRLDWLTKNCWEGFLQAQGKGYLRTFGWVKSGHTVRNVLDAAIRASRRGKPAKPKRVIVHGVGRGGFTLCGRNWGNDGPKRAGEISWTGKYNCATCRRCLPRRKRSRK